MNHKDPRRESSLHTSSSSSPSPEQSVRMLLNQLSQLIKAYTTAKEENTAELGKLIKLVAEELVDRMTVMVAKQGTILAEQSQLREQVKAATSSVASLRALIVERNRLLTELSSDVREVTGSHPLQPQEPEVRVVKWGFVKRIAQQSAPRIIFFLIHFALASLGASAAIQHFVDEAFAVSQGRP